MNKLNNSAIVNIVKQTLKEKFEGNDFIPSAEEMGLLKEPLGVFVTLKKDGKLRGCIGNFESQKPLWQNIKEMALASAFEDDRFTPLQKEELKNLEIEISILSPMKKINSIEEIELGKHGVYIKQGRQNGVFLPQVAKSTGWDKETFLNKLCMEKAGLEAGCWNNPKTEIFIFTSLVVSEKY
jgi:hypothetical protein